MAICRYCGGTFDWGRDDSLEKPWVKLVPIGEDVGMDRTHSDENGVLRAQHSCPGWKAAVSVSKLATPIPSEHIIGQAAVELSADPQPIRPKRRYRKSRLGEMQPLKVLK